MYTVPGLFKDGVALPHEPVEGFEGRQVLITFLDESQKMDEGPTAEEVVARIRAHGLSREEYIPPKMPLVDMLSQHSDEEPIDPAEWDRQWAIVEEEMKQRELEDDRREGR